MKIIQKKLSNSLRSIFIPMENTQAISVLLLINTGSRFENKNENGISHFLEHMFFKGTVKRPSTMHIANELDSIGASYNAFTAEEYTGFYIRCAKTKINIAIDILSDIINNSKFEEAEINKEKGVIVEEINMYEDLPQKQISDITKEHFYGNTPLGRSTLGTKELVQSFSKKNFIDYKDNHYTSKNSVLVIAGNIKEKQSYEMAEKFFGQLNRKYPQSYEKGTIINKDKTIKIKYKNTDQAHLTLGFSTFKRTDKRKYIINVLNNILGETMSSRLFSEVREKRGLAYYVGSDNWFFSDTGLMMAYAGVDKNRINEAVNVIHEEFLKLNKKTITQEELTKAKDNIEGKMSIALEDSFSVAEFYAEQELLHNEIKSPKEIITEIKKISLDQINQLAQSIIKNNNFKLTIIGPYRSNKQFKNLLK